jgi:hypothetical protein
MDISEWFEAGCKKGATHMVVVCDTYDHEDYPVYVLPGQDVKVVEKSCSGNMQRVMEVYNLQMDKALQMNEHRAFHY